MFDQLTLPSGLRLVGEKNSYIRSCSVGVWVNAGSVDEKDSENGLSHFIEHMVFKGTQKRSARDIAEEMDSVGGVLNAYTGKECTCFYAKVTDDELRRAVDVLSDLVCHPVFDERELNKERNVVLEEIAMDEDSPEDLVHEILCQTQYATSLRRPILGTADLIRSYTREDLLRYWQRYYQPANMVVSIVGNYDWPYFTNLVQEFFPAQTIPDFVLPSVEEQRFVGAPAFREKDTEQLHLCLGFPGAARNTRDYYAMHVMNSILGGGMSSRLFQRIREEMGMAYSVYSFASSYADIGDFGLYVATNPENGEKVLHELYRELNLFLKDGPTEREFRINKAQLRGNFLLGLENSSGRMQSLGKALLLDHLVKDPEETLSSIDSTTLEDVMSVARRVLTVTPSAAFVGRGAGAYPKLLGGEHIG